MCAVRASGLGGRAARWCSPCVVSVGWAVTAGVLAHHLQVVEAIGERIIAA